MDSLVNSNVESLARIEQITGTKQLFYKADLRDRDALDAIFSSNRLDAVIHFAGLKAVGESTEKPLYYYQNNLDSTLVLLDVMQAHAVKSLYSAQRYCLRISTCAVCRNLSSRARNNKPYGRTKYFVEEMMSDVAKVMTRLNLRVFATSTLLVHTPAALSEKNPNGTPNNLMPYITQVAVGKRDKLGIFGDNYDTIDGTGVRDYIHVDDLAEGHLAALIHATPGYHTVNLGSGRGTSVLELVHAFEVAAGVTIPYKILPRRSGDLPAYYADASLAASRLNWRTTRTIEDACRDSWNWQSKNPEGYN